MSAAWTRDEVEIIVADYFAMLRAELSGQPVNKAAHNRRLQKQLGRSNGSIEFKHANITAALLELDNLPHIAGYKPRWNYQRLLEQVILERLAIEPDFFEKLADGPVIRPERSAPTDFSRVDVLVEEAPEPAGASGLHQRQLNAAAGRVVRKLDFVRLDAQNRRLGRLGEEWALEFEQRRLHDRERRPDLARQVVWVADAEGDGAGYDIRSFNRDGSRRLVEVKTTGHGKHFPFYVSPNEVVVSERERQAYRLYRLFEFATKPRLFMLEGALSSVCRLQPAQYSARWRAPTTNPARRP